MATPALLAGPQQTRQKPQPCVPHVHEVAAGCMLVCLLVGGSGWRRFQPDTTHHRGRSTMQSSRSGKQCALSGANTCSGALSEHLTRQGCFGSKERCTPVSDIEFAREARVSLALAACLFDQGFGLFANDATYTSESLQGTWEGPKP